MKLSSADAVVIGGGLIGTASAYYLAKMGLTVELVERRDIASETSSGCADALALQTKAPGPKLTLARESVRLYSGLSEELDYDLEFRNEGAMIAAMNEDELEYVSSLVGKLGAAGVPVEILDTRDAREIQPALTPKVLAASYCSLDCHINPLRVSAGFVVGAERLGVRVRRGTEVTGLVLESGRIAGVETSQGRIDTPIVVNAAGVWSPVIARMAGIELSVIPRKGQILVTEALPPVVRGRVFAARYLMSKHSKSDDGGLPGYSAGPILGQQANGNFLVGSTREYVGMDTTSTYEAIVDLASQAVELMPSLENVHIIRAFAGLRPATPDGLPVIRRYPEVEGFIAATGHEGDGICLAPVTGSIVAEIASGRIDDYHQFVPPMPAGREPGGPAGPPAPTSSVV